MSILFGIIVTLASLLGGFIALGGHLSVIWQPWEFVIIAGMALGTYIIANPWKTVVDTGGATIQAITGAVPKQRDYLDLLGVLHALTITSSLHHRFTTRSSRRRARTRCAASDSVSSATGSSA